MTLQYKNKYAINGEIYLPGDKSLSHRAVILGALAKGKSIIYNFLPAEDTINTLKAFEAMGVHYSGDYNKGVIEIQSNGIENFKEPTNILDMGNSGTGSRLLLGFLAGKENFKVTITGDHTLQKRPMKRVTEPLIECGASFQPTDLLPITVEGKKLNTIEREEILGSAQVKSALLLAAISSNTKAIITEKILSRDHTENMLLFSGIPVQIENLFKNGNNIRTITITPPYKFEPKMFKVWGDISSAAFFMVLGALIPNSRVLVRDVLNNPFRNQYLNILKEMGANITITKKQMECGEEGADIEIKGSSLKNIHISPNIIPSIIDEIPILTIAGMFAEGEFKITNAKELRHKESDRIKAMVTNLIHLGYDVKEYEDGFSFYGKPQTSPKGKIESFFDHRIIMSFEIANIVSKYFSNIDIKNDNNFIIIDKNEQKWISTSFPSFYEKINLLIKEQ